jgi:hypothetical protein
MTCEGCKNFDCWQEKIPDAELKKNTRLEERRKNIPDSITQKVDEQYNRIVNADIEEAFKSEAARDYWLTDEKIKEIILDYTKWYYDMYTLPNYGTDEVIANDYIKYKNNIKKEE